MTTSKQIKETFNKVSELNNKLRKDCYDYLRETLANHNNRIVLVDVENDEYADEVIQVTYDGGNHPEYAGNPYSQVYSVFIKEGTDRICLETEDDDEYDLDCVWSTMEVYDVCNAVIALIEE